MAVYSDPLAYLLTWTCRGTWLHGDERGSVDQSHNGFGTPRLRPDTRVEDSRYRLMSGPVRTLTAANRLVVADAINAHCGVRGWRLLAQNPRSNHVHVVVSAPRVEPQKVLQELKSWSTRYLRRLDETFVDPWTDGGSKQYLFKQEDVDAAVRYVLVEQDRVERFVRPRGGEERR